MFWEVGGDAESGVVVCVGGVCVDGVGQGGGGRVAGDPGGVLFLGGGGQGGVGGVEDCGDECAYYVHHQVWD